MKFMYRPVKRNFSSRGKNPKILYLVIHDTGNTGIGANALNHKNYVGTNSRKASAHYFVDDHSIVQFVGDSFAAHAVGDGHGRYGITNENSLNVEMCINSDGDYAKTYKNTVELAKNLMKKFNISIDRVVRHYDASRKNCPGHMRQRNWAKWWQFKEDIQKPIEWKIDLSKDSEFGELEERSTEVTEKEKCVSDWAEKAWTWGIEKGIIDGTNPKGQCTREQVITMLYRVLANKVTEEKPTWRARHFSVGDYEIIETAADNVRIEKTLRIPLNVDGINGTFYNLKGSEIYGLAMQDGKEIETNSYVTNFHSLKRGTIYYDGKKLHHAMVYNAKSEIKDYIKWGISGISLYPIYNPKAEGFTGAYADVLRATKHTVIGFKGDKVYLIASAKALTLENFRNGLLNSRLAFDGLINLDGGGSTQMSFGGKKVISSTRPLNHCIRLLSV